MGGAKTFGTSSRCILRPCVKDRTRNGTKVRKDRKGRKDRNGRKDGKERRAEEILTIGDSVGKKYRDFTDFPLTRHLQYSNCCNSTTAKNKFLQSFIHKWNIGAINKS